MFVANLRDDADLKTMILANRCPVVKIRRPAFGCWLLKAIKKSVLQIKAFPGVGHKNLPIG
jgi:hypothetical protein